MNSSDRSKKAVFINSESLGSYSFGPEHPFKPERVKRVSELCRSRGLFDAPSVEVVSIEEPEEGVLKRFHTRGYIEALKRADTGRDVDVDMLHHGLGTAENPVFKGVYRFAELSATATLTAARLVADGAESAFNPVGGFHHAHRDRASGFCYVNDIAIAIDELLGKGVRVAYIDTDAHHGDAVQEAYYDNERVLIISMHETGKTLFPWGGFENEIGEGNGKGFNINIPLEPGTDDEIFLYLFKEVAMRAVEAFKPDLVVGQFGTDMLATDPLTHLHLTNNGYIEAVESLHSGVKRIVALGGGGYNLKDVEKCWTLLWAELAGLELREDYGGAMGGVFLGDTNLSGSDLRDMRVYTTGPDKERLKERADELIAFFEGKVIGFIR